MRVLYVATNYAALSHTFIAREVTQLRRRGLQVALLSLRAPATTAAETPECDLTGCLYAYPVSPVRWANGLLRAAVRHPRGLARAIAAALTSPGDSARTRFKLLFQLGVATAILPAIERADVQHVHAHFAGSPATFALFFNRLLGLPFSFTDHGAGVYHDRVALQAKFRHAAGISAISEFNTRFYRQLTDRLPPVRVVHCGLDLDAFPFRQRGACGDPLRILAVSRLVAKKGFTHLLDALRLLSDRGLRWEARIVGEGPLRTELQQRALELGLGDLTFTGPLQQPEIRRLMLEVDVFTLPCVVAPDGDMDGIPVTLMEAMASGCPVVTTPISGNPELVVDGRSGLMVPSGDATALADALGRLAADPALSTHLSRGGREWVSREFNIAVSAEKLETLFAEASARGGRHEA